MQKIIKYIKSLSKKQIYLLIAGFLAILALFYSLTNDPVITVVKASKGSIEEEVLVTGKTRPAEEVDLGLEKGGKVTKVIGKIGSPVYKGDTLVVLDQSSLLADLRKAQANLNEELVRLDSTKQSTNLLYEDAYSKAFTELKDAYISADNAVRNNADAFFDEPQGENAKFNITFKDGPTTYYFKIPSSQARSLGLERVEIEQVLLEWNKKLNRLDEGDGLFDSLNEGEVNLNKVKTFLSNLALAINSLTTDDFEQEPTIQGYKTSLSNARTEVSSALSNLLRAKADLNNAPTTSNIKNNKEFSDVEIGKARVEGLRADVSSIQTELSKLVLRSPISGVITQADAKVGEIVGSGDTLISIISDKKLEIEANVSEINIGKVKIGDKVNITFDAFPSEIFIGNVSYVDPAETIIDGVPTYKITVIFTDEITQNVRSGLTANLQIETFTKENVIKIPRYAVFKEDGKSFVNILVKSREEKREITTGLIGKDGTIEVISGISEGEEINAESK